MEEENSNAATGGDETPGAVDQLESVGVDVTNPEVQSALIGDVSVEDIISQFGDPEKVAALQSPDGDDAGKEAAATEDGDPSDPDSDGDPDKKDKAKADDGQQPKPANRFRFSSEEDRKHVAAAKELGVTLHEYFELQRQKSAPVKDPPDKNATNTVQSAEDDDPIAKFDTEITDIDKQIAELETKSDKLVDDLEFTEARKIDRKVDRLKDKRRELLSNKDKAELQQTIQRDGAQRRFESAKAQAEADAIAKYPQLGNPKSLEGRAFITFYNEYAKEDPAVFDKPDWVLVLADKFAEENGIKPASGDKADAKPKPSAAKPQGHKPQQVSRTTILTSGDGGSSSRGELQDGDVDKVLSDISKLPPGERMKYEKMIFSGN